MTRFGRTIRREMPTTKIARRPIITELVALPTGAVILRLHEKGRRLAVEYDIEQLYLRGVVAQVRSEAGTALGKKSAAPRRGRRR